MTRAIRTRLVSEAHVIIVQNRPAATARRHAITQCQKFGSKQRMRWTN